MKKSFDDEIDVIKINKEGELENENNDTEIMDPLFGNSRLEDPMEILNIMFPGKYMKIK